MIKKTYLIAAYFFVAACAPTPDAPNFVRGLNALEERNYVVAYRFFEDVRSHEIDKVLALIDKNPKLINAALETFSIPALHASISRYGKSQSLDIELRRLNLFERYANSDQINFVRNNIKEIYGDEFNVRAEGLKIKGFIDNLDDEQRSKYYSDQYNKYQDSIKIIGRIMSSQLINRSNPGTSIGSLLGAAVGQVIYIDSVNFNGYSAGNQLGAGVLGAIIGSSFDKKKAETYQKVYFIKKKDGSIVRLDQNTSDQVLFPVGACIFYKEPFDFNITEEKNCE